MDKELMPCPFCGGEAAIKVKRSRGKNFMLPNQKTGWSQVIFIGCFNASPLCEVRPQTYFPDRQTAIEAWNRRV